MGQVRGKPKPAKPISSNTDRVEPKGGSNQTRHITILIKGNYVKRTSGEEALR